MAHSALHTIGTLLDRQAERLGNSPFLILPEADELLTFAEVATGARTIGHTLARNGCRAGDRVVLILPNGKESTLSLLAVMGAGGVAVPLNPRLTDEEIGVAIEDSAARFIIRLASRSPGEKSGCHGFTPVTDDPLADIGIVLLSRLPETAHSAPVAVPIAAAAPALILFTSGTTGRPKGVPLSHANLLANASFVQVAHSLSATDTALCILGLFHINGLVVTLLTPLLTGMPVVLPTRFDVTHFWSWVSRYGVSWFSAVPTILSLLLSHGIPDRAARGRLRFVRSASAPLPVAIMEEFERQCGIPVIETYGISEAACQVTANPLPPLLRKPGSAGKAVGNELKVRDEQGVELPCGVAGEVVIRGSNLFGGYLTNPLADSEALRQGWFHTGDLGYLDGEGYLFLTGRKKEIINRAGEKISPREVEEVIHRLAEVEAVGVVGVPHQLYGEEVTAFITLRPGAVVTNDEIRDFCRHHLAGFKVPRELFFIDEFPKGPSGKIQRRRLVDLYLELQKSTQSVRHTT